MVIYEYNNILFANDNEQIILLGTNYLQIVLGNVTYGNVMQCTLSIMVCRVTGYTYTLYQTETCRTNTTSSSYTLSEHVLITYHTVPSVPEVRIT